MEKPFSVCNISMLMHYYTLYGKTSDVIRSLGHLDTQETNLLMY